jgi:hypothetical protein
MTREQILALVDEIQKLPDQYSIPLMNLLRKQTGWVWDEKRCP